MSHERVTPDSRVSQSGDYGYCGDIERSGAEMDGGMRDLRILRQKRDGGFGQKPPILVRRTSRGPQRDRASARGGPISLAAFPRIMGVMASWNGETLWDKVVHRRFRRRAVFKMA